MEDSADKQNRLNSRKGTAIIAPEGRFRAADIKVPLLISNVSIETSEDGMIRYIKDKTSAGSLVLYLYTS